ncbi:MAG: Ig-like domain repeat protein [Gemmataceae bacterium]|nr:Ig-like domain repeat protein [Gemmataceae bacterium]
MAGSPRPRVGSGSLWWHRPPGLCRTGREACATKTRPTHDPRIGRRIELLEDRTTPAPIPYAGGTYANHFDWLPAAGTVSFVGNGPYGFDAPPFALGTGPGDHTPRGWQLYKHAGTGGAARFLVDDGSNTNGAAYSYGTGAAADRALGQLASGTVMNALGATFTNTGTTTYTAFTVSFTVEQWRRGGTAGPDYDAQPFEYATDSGGLPTTDIATGAFVPAPGGDLTTVNAAGARTPTDGNAPANRVSKTVTVSGVVWAPGQNLTIRWRDTDTPLADDGLAVDDFTFAAGVGGPPPGFTAGNVVVARDAGGAVTLDEFTPGGAVAASVALPTDAGGDMFTLSGGPGEGLLTRSADGRFLLLGGHRQLPGGDVAGADRLVAAVGADTTIDLPTRLPAGDFGAVRAVASADGLGYYLATDAGVRYVPFGNPAGAGVSILSATEDGPTVTVTTAAPHGLTAGQSVTVGGVSVAGYGGTFVVAAASTATTFTYVAPVVGLPDGTGGATGGLPHSVLLGGLAGSVTSVDVGPDGRPSAVLTGTGPATIGTGLPIVGGQAIQSLTGFPAGGGQVVFGPDGRTAYRADGRTDGAGGLYRYELTDGGWVQTAAATGTGLFGLAADFAGPEPVIYATTVEADGSANRLVRFTDPGGGSIPGPVVLAVAGAGSVYRGVALSPVAAGTAPTTTDLSVGAGTGAYGAGVTLTATVARTGETDPPPAGVVSFRAGGVEVGAAVLVDGVATFTTAGNLGVFGGPHGIVAVYTGSPTDAGSTSAARTVGITPAATTTTVFVSPDPIPVGVDTVLSAVLTVPAGTRPTGTVTFSDGAAAVGTVQPLAGVVEEVAGALVTVYRAAVTVRFTTGGVKSITAAYSGDVNFSGGVSPPASLTVASPAGELAFAAAEVAAVADPGVVYLTATRTGGAAGAVTVEGYTTDGTAADGTDFVGASFTLTFADGQTSAEVPVLLLLPPAPYDGSRAFTVTLQNPTGGAVLGGQVVTTLTLTDPPLRVVGEPVIDGGSVTVAFNRRVDPAGARLYDAPGRDAGPADFVVLDAATDLPAAVRGSLAAGPDGASVTLVNTAGAVPEGMVRARLGAGFRGLDGRPLDGDGDGLPGGAYTSGVRLVGPSGATVGVHGVGRGPGEAVNLPVVLGGAAAVTEAGFTLTYDPSLLTIPETGAVALSADAAAAGLVLMPYTVTVLDDHRAVLAVSAAGGAGWTPPAGGGVLLTVAGTVPADAPYGAVGWLDVDDVTVNGSAAVAVDGVHAVVYPGDATGDRTYSARDAALITQVGAVAGAGFPLFARLDPVIVGDVTGDGLTDAADADRVARKGGGGDVPELPDLPPVAPPGPSGPDAARLYFESVAAGPGQTVTVRLRLSVLAAAGMRLSALDEAIRFDPAVITVSNVRGGALFGAAGAFATLAPTVDNVNGVLRVAQFAAEPGGVPLAYGADADVLVFDVTVNPAAAAGLSSVLNLLAAADRTTTAVSDNDRSLVLAPAPTDGDDAGVDGAVSVIGPTGRLSLGSATVAAGEAVTVPVWYENGPVPLDLTAADVAVGFDPGDLEAVAVAGAGGFAAVTWELDNTAGRVRFGLVAAGPLALAPGQVVELAVLTFRAGAAAAGTTYVNLRAAGGPTVTTVSGAGGPVELVPPPDDATGDALDAEVVIVPEVNRPPAVAVPDTIGRPAPRLLFDPAAVPGLRVADASRHTFSAIGGNPIVVSDPDAGDSPVSVRLVLAGDGPVGTLTLATTAGLTVAGDGTSAVTLDGPLAAINAALDGLRYAPGPGYFGTTAVRVDVDDLGHTGPGGPRTASASTAVEVVGLFVSEVMLGPEVGRPAPNQYVEVVSTAADYLIPPNVFLVGVEGDRGGDPANNPGLVQDVLRLGGFRTGANGYLALLHRDEPYTAAGAVGAGGAVLANTPVTPDRGNAGFGNGGATSRYVQDGVVYTGVHVGQLPGTGLRPGASRYDQRTDLERGSVSYLLTRGPAPAIGTDIDPDDDGLPGGAVYDRWTVLDGVAVLDADGPDRAYAPVTFAAAGDGAALPGSAVVGTGGWTATYVGRVGRSVGHAAADWVGAAVAAVRGAPAGTFALPDGRSTAFPGQLLAHVGAANDWAPRAAVLVNDGADPQRSHVGQLTVTFGRPVDIAGLGAFALSGPAPVGFAVTPLDGTANGDGSYSGVTTAVVRFAAGPGTVPYATPDPWGNTVGLADGDYVLTVDAAAVTAGGVPLDGDLDGRPGGDRRFAFRRRFGDADGDGRVGSRDERVFRVAFGTAAGDPNYRYFFDVELDGDIDAADRAAFRANRG